jgi:hypothetical protein
MYRGACRHCEWEGDPRRSENSAAEDALGHSWPGWRDLPLVGHIPEERKARARWIETVNRAYPAGWLEGGRPIRALRTPPGTRHAASATPFGGYDVGVVKASGA